MKDDDNATMHAVLKGDRRAVARLITRVENTARDGDETLRAVFKHTGKAYRIGITGPPGAGKSTITNKLAAVFRARGGSVGIIAVDPTSPFTGGALLGDRVRMADVELDDGIFIRSMASRGSSGGLSRKAAEAADVLDAAGFETILFETVGVGQSELDIAGAADTTVVVLVPESGDAIQAMKAGLMEIADLFVLNKGDRPGADHAVMSIKMILGFRPHNDTTWMTGVLKTQANDGKGIDELAAAIDRHREFLVQTESLAQRRQARLRGRIRAIVEAKLDTHFWTPERSQELDEVLSRVVSREKTPYDVADDLLAHFAGRTT